ncbi:MAG: ABC transporter substrate-binding protein, partial [Spirochaetales bacterium]|nr:ABC transporter substrate-binding protein [Spirochaetales bacterium]
MKHYMLRLLLVLLSSGVLCAAGRGEPGGDDGGVAGNGGAPTVVSEALQDSEMLTAADVGLAEPAPNSVELVEVTDECRVIRDAQRDTCVPLNPVRIVSMDGALTEHLIALDRTPIGSRFYNEGDTAITPALVALSEDIESVGTWPPNIERVLVLEPDLIITPDWMFSQIPYEQFAAIAPTVMLRDANDWRTTLEDIALITGDEETARALIGRFYVDAAALDERIPDMDIALLRPRPDLMQVYGTDAEATRILEAFGLSLTPVPRGATNLWGDGGREAGQISYETLDLIEGEIFFVISYNLEPAAMDEFRS